MEIDEEEESAYLFTIFPEELWHLILDNITDQPTYRTICSSSPILEGLLHRGHYARILFTSVVKVFYYHFYSRHHNLRLAYTLLLKCRSACRHWKEAADQLLQNQPYLRHPSKDAPGPISVCHTSFNSFLKVRSFTEHFQQSHDSQEGLQTRNPFLCRALAVTLRCCRDPLEQVEIEIFVEDLLDMLRDYGSHLWYASFILVGFPHYSCPIRHYSRVRDFLEVLPNLKTLQLHYMMSNLHTRWEMEALEANFRAEPMPSISSLDYLVHDHLHVPVLKSLLRSNPQLRSLESVTPAKALFQEVVSVEMPHLEQLTMRAINNYEFACLHFQMEESWWPITKLHVDFMNLCVGPQEIFEVLSKFKNTLEQLYIVFPAYGSPPEHVPLVNLPNLEVLEIVLQNFANLDIFLGLKETLRELSVWVDREVVQQTNEYKEGILHVFSCEQLHHSNIWKEFKNLQKLKTSVRLGTPKWRHCTRKEWAKYNGRSAVMRK